MEKISVKDVARVIDFLGEKRFKKLAEMLPDYRYQSSSLDIDDLVHLFDQINKKDRKALLEGKCRIVVDKADQKLFDDTGRYIPEDWYSRSDENLKFHVEISDQNYDRLKRQLEYSFPKGTKFYSAKDFQYFAEKIKDKYVGNDIIGSFFKRARPIMLPQCDARKNVGISLRSFFFPAVQIAYKRCFSNHRELSKVPMFVDCKKIKLDEDIYINPGTGHNRLISRMAKEPVVAWYSPNPFQGYDFSEQFEAMERLRQYGFALTGGVDTATALVMYAEDMARDYQVPKYTCSALSRFSNGGSFVFFAYEDALYFREYNYNIPSNRSAFEFDLYLDAYAGGLVLFE